VNLVAMLQQAGQEMTAVGLIMAGTIYTHIVLAITAVFSLLSWVLIFWKIRQFRAISKEAVQFNESIERTQRLEDAYRAVVRLPPSPFVRLFRQGVNFFSELRPGSLREGAAPGPGLSEAQLQALRLVLEKVQGEEEDQLSAGLVWLAIIAVVSPLLGLLGTVIGVMDSFIGIGTTGSANIAAVAPGIAEALITTAAGLVAAIPAAIGYNYFVSRLNFFGGEMEGFASEFIGTLAREGRL
jgi:biopolymer transport protein TolQ